MLRFAKAEPSRSGPGRTWRAILFLLCGLSGCSYQPGGIDNPITRKFSWFSYAGADDIKQGCRPGELDRYRFIYNAIYDEQVRAYDLRQSATGRGAVLFVRVLGDGGNVASFDPTDPTGPWRGSGSEAVLTREEYQRLLVAVRDSGFWQPAPQGLSLPSIGFYWLAAACVDGRFHYNAWRHPSDQFQRLALLPALLPFDRTGVGVNPPRAVLDNPPRGPIDNPDSSFTLRVGQNGLVGHLRLF